MAKVKLGDVAREYNSTIKVRTSETKIVGLEHLTPEEITLSNWNENVENTFTKEFKKGHVLFGRRRAYLKKAAYAHFDGICSGDITVIEAIDGKIEKDLLPFIIQNEKLFDFAIGKSAGSLSPRVKWEHLKNYEFELPSLPEQKKLAKILWSAERLKQKYSKLLNSLVELKSKNIENALIDGSCRLTELGLLLKHKPEYGMLASKIPFDGINRYVRITDLNSEGNLTDYEIVSPSIVDDKYLLIKNDLLFARSGSVGVSYLHGEQQKCYFAGYLIRFTINEHIILPQYIFEVAQSKYFWSWIEEIKKTGTISNINAQEYMKFKVPLVGMDVQLKIVEKAKQMKVQMDDICKQIIRLQEIQIKLISGGNKDVQ